MRFSELVKVAIELLKTTEKISYRALRREFELDDETLDDLKHELRVGPSAGEVLVRSIRKGDLHRDDVPVVHSINLAARFRASSSWRYRQSNFTGESLRR